MQYGIQPKSESKFENVRISNFKEMMRAKLVSLLITSFDVFVSAEIVS